MPRLWLSGERRTDGRARPLQWRETSFCDALKDTAAAAMRWKMKAVACERCAATASGDGMCERDDAMRPAPQRMRFCIQFSSVATPFWAVRTGGPRARLVKWGQHGLAGVIVIAAVAPKSLARRASIGADSFMISCIVVVEPARGVYSVVPTVGAVCKLCSYVGASDHGPRPICQAGPVYCRYSTYSL